MGDELEVISDGEGLAIIGDPAAVERFVADIDVESKDLGLGRLRSGAMLAAAAAQAGSLVAANSGRWIKLTKESAEKVKQAGLMDSTTPGVKHLMAGKPGEIQSWLQTSQSVGSSLANPAMASGAAGLMAQLAMQQAMNEITDYLEEISEKLDDVMRTQVNTVLAELDAADLAIREAMTVRDAVGRVSEVNWSKVQSTAGSILKTQSFAIRQLRDLTDKVERKSKIDELMKQAKEIESEVQKWLSVLARSFQLQDGMAVLELDRVLDSSPEELERHRTGLRSARDDRLELISDTTQSLLDRMQDAAERANSRVLFNPMQSPAVVKSANSVAEEVHGLHTVLGIESGRQSAEAARWRDAAADGLGTVRDVSGQGVQTVKVLGGKTFDQALSVKGKLSGRLADRKRRRTDKSETASGDEGSD